MIAKCLLVLLPCLLLASPCLAQEKKKAAASGLEEHFSSLTGKELRELAHSRDGKESSDRMKELSARLRAKEEGKECTIHCTSSGKVQDMKEFLSLTNDPTKSQIRIDGELVQVRISTRVGSALAPKLKECRAGRKIFITGKIDHIMVGRATASNGLVASLSLMAEDLGPDK